MSYSEKSGKGDKDCPYLETEKAIDNSGRISGILSFDVGMVGYR